MLKSYSSDLHKSRQSLLRKELLIYLYNLDNI